MSCDVGEMTERLENELSLEPFRHFTYVATHSPTLPSLYLRQSSFSNPSFASPTSQALHLIHLASRPWKEPLWRASIPGISRIPNVLAVRVQLFSVHLEYNSVSILKYSLEQPVFYDYFVKYVSWRTVVMNFRQSFPHSPEPSKVMIYNLVKKFRKLDQYCIGKEHV